MDEFCDITCKFGYGYKMSNGLVGFYYNDRTLLLLIEYSNNKEIRYYDECWVEKVYREEKLMDEHDLKKKLYILEAFRKAICQFKKPASSAKKIVFIKDYIKVKNAKLFHLSNDTAQAKFIDNSQVLCQSAEDSYYIDKKGEGFRHIEKEDSGETLIREIFTRELARKLFNWLKPSDEVKYERENNV